MNEEITKNITPKNVLSYSNACIDLAYELIHLKDEGFARIVLPSRGAYPFYNGAITSLHFLIDSAIERTKFSLNYNLWLLPFTSDWGDTAISITSGQIRKFWAKILADSLRKEKTPYLKFYQGLVQIIGESYTVNTSDLLLEKSHKRNLEGEKFVFIDTAISGRAISEIIESFYEFNLTDFYIILIVDDNGESLKPVYKNIIEREISRGKIKQLNVEKIFSEDASPLLNTGISSIVFPNLIEQAYNDVKEFRNDGFVGGGLWFIDSVSHIRQKATNLNGVRGVLSTLNYVGIRQNLYGDNMWFEDMVAHDAEDIIRFAGEFNIYDPANTKRLVYDRIKHKEVVIPEKSVDVSSSHVIRIQLEQAAIQSFLKHLKL